MKKIVLISPFAKKMRTRLPDGQEKTNPKNYPYWKEVVQALQKNNCHIIQIGVEGESSIGADEVRHNLNLHDLQKLLNSCDSWISVDSFFQHLAWDCGKPGIVLFGQSDPNIFGHPENINLLKDRSYLREKQFWWWEQCEYKEDAFVKPAEVLKYL